MCYAHRAYTPIISNQRGTAETGRDDWTALRKSRCSGVEKVMHVRGGGWWRVAARRSWLRDFCVAVPVAGPWPVRGLSSCTLSSLSPARATPPVLRSPPASRASVQPSPKRRAETPNRGSLGKAAAGKQVGCLYFLPKRDSLGNLPIRIESGVTSTNSPATMYSTASSRVSCIGAVVVVLSSAPADRMLVSCLALQIFTLRSLSLAWMPMI
mmetsp:Transcript_7148/g.18754  ORF Transcript_7148/g.18754 Transcript_7148/m.18754 type:complete len:211 (-) Transcript_7148:94-726(-)